MGGNWQAMGEATAYTIAGLACLAGFFLSCLSLSGTWLVFAATAILSVIFWPDYPGLVLPLVFLMLCIAVEVLEAVASAWGVQKRGGSKAAGWAALGGGLFGMVAGGMLIPIIGNLLGMLVFSFTAAFLVERSNMKKTEHAAHIAFGAVLARIGVIFLKVGVTVAMTAALFIGLAIQ
jgi:uncharacterized protein YqgC (DUF456 family)